MLAAHGEDGEYSDDGEYDDDEDGKFLIVSGWGVVYSKSSFGMDIVE